MSSKQYTAGFSSASSTTSTSPSSGGRMVDYSDGGTYDDLFTGNEFMAPPEQSTSYSTGTMQQTQPMDEFPGMTQVVVEQPVVSDEEAKKKYRLWDVQYYSFLFDVDTNEVLGRLTRSVVPFSVNFLATVKDNPDMYGPFWVVTTLIFLNAATGNLALWIHQRDDFRYHFEEVTFGAGAFYGYVTIVPTLLWIALKWFDVPISLLQTMCIYGYSMFIYLPVAILCIIPLEPLRWVLVFVAGAWSLLFLLMNFYPPLLKDKWHDKKATTYGGAVLAAVAICHMGLALTIKLYFFHYSD